MKRLSAFRRREAWVGGLTRRPRLPLPRIRILETYYVLLKRYVFNRFLSICYSNVVFHAVLSKGCSNIVLHANHILLLYYIILYYIILYPSAPYSLHTNRGRRPKVTLPAHTPPPPANRPPPAARHPLVPAVHKSTRPNPPLLSLLAVLSCTRRLHHAARPTPVTCLTAGGQPPRA